MGAAQTALGPVLAVSSVDASAGSRAASARALRLVGSECAAALLHPDLLVTYTEFHRLTGMLGRSTWEYFTKIMMLSNEPDHDRLRQFARGPYSARRVAELRARAQQIADHWAQRLGDLSSNGQVDLVAEYAFRVPMAVTGNLLGIPLPTGWHPRSDHRLRHRLRTDPGPRRAPARRRRHGSADRLPRRPAPRTSAPPCRRSDQPNGRRPGCSSMWRFPPSCATTRPCPSRRHRSIAINSSNAASATSKSCCAENVPSISVVTTHPPRRSRWTRNPSGWR